MTRSGEVVASGVVLGIDYRFDDNSLGVDMELFPNFCLGNPLEPKRVYFYNFTTKCLFPDGDVVTVSLQDGDGPFDAEKGIALCILKKMFGGSRFNDVLREARERSNYKDDTELRHAMLRDRIRHEFRKKKHEEAE